MVHTEFTKGCIAKWRLIPEKHEWKTLNSRKTLGATPGQQHHSGSSHIMLADTKCNRSSLASLKFPFVLYLAGTIVALLCWLRNKQW